MKFKAGNIVKVGWSNDNGLLLITDSWNVTDDEYDEQIRYVPLSEHLRSMFGCPAAEPSNGDAVQYDLVAEDIIDLAKTRNIFSLL